MGQLLLRLSMHAFPSRLFPLLATVFHPDIFSTRLKVPIDYSNEGGEKAALAVIKLSAQSETEYKGAVLMNPGGPGGSGVSTLTSIGQQLSSIIGNQYDIISFDPRGSLTYLFFITR